MTYVALPLILLVAAIFFTSGANQYPKTRVKLVDLSASTIPYETAWNWQKKLLDHHVNLQDRQQLQPQPIAGHVLLLQHKSVYTLGSSTTDDWLKSTSGRQESLEYETFAVERGGQATYHGPGQLVLYPIIDLSFFEKDINAYLRGLEQVVINTAAEFEVLADRVDGLTGVWVGDKKISAIGIKLRRWVTMHGLSLNVCPDMRYFDKIIPCGITDKAVGSLSSMNPKATVNSVSNVLLNQFADVFNVDYIPCQDKRDNSASDKSYNSDDDTLIFRYLESIT